MSASRKRVSVAAQEAWQQSIFPQDAKELDEIDRELDEMIVADPHVSGTNNRRSDKELARILNIIDTLPISTNGKDGHA